MGLVPALFLLVAMDTFIVVKALRARGVATARAAVWGVRFLELGTTLGP